MFSKEKLVSPIEETAVAEDFTCWGLWPVGHWEEFRGSQYLVCYGGSEYCWVELPCPEE